MKKTSTFYVLSTLIGLLGVVQLISAWVVGEGGSLGDFTQGELYVNSLLFLVIAIWLAHGVMIHHHKND